MDIKNVERPQDIKQSWWDGWMRLVRRLQSVSRKHEGYAIVGMMVVVNQDGTPILFLEPKIKKIEPRRSEAIRELSESLNEEDFQNILELLWLHG